MSRWWRSSSSPDVDGREELTAVVDDIWVRGAKDFAASTLVGRDLCGKEAWRLIRVRRGRRGFGDGGLLTGMNDPLELTETTMVALIWRRRGTRS